MNKNKLEYQILVFLLIGGLATTIDFVIYNYLFTFFSINISKLISMLSSSLFSYFMHKFFTFNKVLYYIFIKFINKYICKLLCL